MSTLKAAVERFVAAWQGGPRPARLAIPLTIVLAAVTLAVLYAQYGRPADERTQIVDLTQPSAPVLASGGTASATAVARAAGDVPTRPEATTAAVPSPSTAKPSDAGLLRPGATLLSRFDLSLDGGSTAQVAVSSRYTATDQCQTVYADVLAPRGGAWQRVFAADDPNLPYGPLLPAPVRAGAGCFPQLRLFSAQNGGAGGDFLLLAASYEDTSLRLMVLGWDAAEGRPAILYDRRSGPNGRYDRAPGGDSIDLSEDLVSQGSTPVTVGRFTQTVMLRDGAATVTGRRLAPNCDRGRLAAGAQIVDGSAPLLVACSNGTQVAVALDGNTHLLPDGVTVSDVQTGDYVQLEFEPSSLTPPSPEGALPLAASMTDGAAGTRHAAAERAAQRAAQPVTAPRQAAGGTQGNAPASQPRASGAGAQPAVPRSGSGTTGSTRPAGATTGASSSLPPPLPTLPAPVVSPPPAPRSPPFAGPPPTAPR